MPSDRKNGSFLKLSAGGVNGGTHLCSVLGKLVCAHACFLSGHLIFGPPHALPATACLSSECQKLFSYAFLRLVFVGRVLLIATDAANDSDGVLAFGTASAVAAGTYCCDPDDLV